MKKLRDYYQNWFIKAGLTLLLTIFVYLSGTKLLPRIHADNPQKKLVPGKQILVISPHPDDEILATAGLISQFNKGGYKVKIVMITNGDGFEQAIEKNFGIVYPKPKDYIGLGRIRAAESLASAKILGIKQKDIIFLGYPDAGLNKLWEDNWNYNTPYRGSTGQQYSPYDFVYEKKAVFCGLNLTKNLRQIIKDFKPTDIVYPDPYDENGDHSSVSAFTKLAVIQSKIKTNEWTYLVHKKGFPYPSAFNPDLSLKPPSDMNKIGTRWFVQNLNKDDQELKLKALEQHRTQLKMRNIFLRSFIRRNELFGVISDPILVQTNRNRKDLLTLVREPVSGTLNNIDTPKSDANIETISGSLTENRLNIALKTISPINKNIDYNIDTRIVYPEDTNRIYVKVNRLKPVLIGNTGEMLKPGSGFKVKVSGNVLTVSLPETIVDNAKGLFLIAKSYYNGKLVDQTARKYVAIDRLE